MTKTLLCAAALAIAPAFALAHDAQVAAAPAGIEIRGMRFEPAVLTIPPGTTVTWLNEDKSPHTVADRGRVFRSAALDTEDRFSVTFATPGEFSYFCTLHPMMIGRIVVKPAGS